MDKRSLDSSIQGGYGPQGISSQGKNKEFPRKKKEGKEGQSKHAAYRAYHFVSPSPPCPQGELALFWYRKAPLSRGKAY